MKHQLGIGLDLKQMVQHAKSNRDIDMDDDVDKLDKTTPDEITGAEKKDQTPKMMAKYAKEKQHTKVGNAFEAHQGGSCKCDDPEYTSKGMCKECGNPQHIKEALDPVDPKTVHKPLLARKNKNIDNNGKVDDSDKYIHKRRQTIARSLAIHEDALHPDAHKVLKHIKPEHQEKYKLDLTKKHYTGNYADHAAVIKAAHNARHLNEDVELKGGWDDMLKGAKERNNPQPNGGAGKKQGSANGSSKQKDAPAPKNEEVEQIDELSKETLGSYKHKAELSIPKDDRAYILIVKKVLIRLKRRRRLKSYMVISTNLIRTRMVKLMALN